MQKITLLSILLMSTLVSTFTVPKSVTLENIPLLTYGSPPYFVSPARRMTAQQKNLVSQAFSSMETSFKSNRTNCKGRGECLKMDFISLQTFLRKNPSHPAKPFLENIYQFIRRDSQGQKFTSQYAIFQSLSKKRQQEFISGLRISPLTHQTVRELWGTTWIIAPAQYNQDDVFTILLQNIEHQHKNCEHYLHCLSTDLQIMQNLYKRLAITDPVRPQLIKLRNTVQNLASQKLFNSFLYLKLYNPLSPRWSDTLTKRNMAKGKAGEISGYGYNEWQQIIRTSRPVQWLPARITNGKPVA